MRVIVFVKATADSERGAPPAPGMLEAMGRFNDELRKAGVLLMAEGLEPSSQGRRVAFDGSDRTVTDGPFDGTSDLIAGFWLWEVSDLDEAVAWARRCPNPMPGPSGIEIRPLMEFADIAPFLPPEIARIEDRAERWAACADRSAPTTGTDDPAA